jgi:aspartate racemase
MGVLGGMGPAATIDFLAKVLAANPVQADQDHVPMIIYNVPQIPDRVAPIFAGTDEPLDAMQQGMASLQGAGVAGIAIACVTAHHWYERLAQNCSVPVLHIADATAQALHARASAKRLALLATRGTCRSGFFSRRLAVQGFEIVVPDEDVQIYIDQAIAAIKRADHASATIAAEAAGAALEAQGLTDLLLACTELPMAFAATRYHARCLDSTLALAEACVAFSRSDHQR